MREINNSYSPDDYRYNGASEQGFYLVLLAVFLTGILSIIGLAIDGGSLYLASVRLQQAVDASVLVAGRKIGEITEDELDQLSREVVLTNVASAGITTGVSVTSNLDTSTNILEVSARYSVNTLFFGSVLEGVAWNEVYATASIEQRQVAIVIVADRTGSMASLVRLPDGRVKSRADLFKDAALVFGTHFDQSDRIGVVSFSNDYTVERSINEPYDYLSYANSIHNIGGAGGFTNLQVGILAGFEMLMNLEEKEKYDLYMVIATDGVPNRNVFEHGNRQSEQLLDWATNYSRDDIDLEVPNLRQCRGGPEQRENYIAAQRAADLVRSAGVKVFSLAFGSDLDRSATARDPWGRHSSSNPNAPISESYVRSLSFDHASAQYYRDIPFLDECTPSYQEMGQRGHFPGVSTITNDPTSISGLLARIAGSIKFRIAS